MMEAICYCCTSRGDQTPVGHALGSAQQRSNVPAPERQLTPVATATLRILLHMAMFLGANTKEQVREGENDYGIKSPFPNLLFISWVKVYNIN